MAEPHPLDSAWLREHPLPMPHGETDKNRRGRVYVIGGSSTVPGGLRLTAEAALRAGAGKVQMATIASNAAALGIAVPEAAVFALAETPEGEIAGFEPRLAAGLGHCDALVAGPAMSCGEAAGRIIDGLVGLDELPRICVVDAAPLMTLNARAAAIAAGRWPLVLTPHIGEMAALLDCDAATIAGDRRAAALRAAERYGAVVVLKGATSLIADPHGGLYGYAGGGPGLATSGSGDVLAGIIGGLGARGVSPLDAALWGVWLHGEAGRRCAERTGPIGFLARELLDHVPALMGGF